MKKTLLALLTSTFVLSGFNTANASILNANLTDSVFSTDNTGVYGASVINGPFLEVGRYSSTDVPDWWTNAVTGMGMPADKWQGMTNIAYLKFHLPASLDFSSILQGSLNLYGFGGGIELTNYNFGISFFGDDSWSESANTLPNITSRVGGAFFPATMTSYVDGNSYLTRLSWDIDRDAIPSTEILDPYINAFSDGFLTIEIDAYIDNSVYAPLLSEDYDQELYEDEWRPDEIANWNANILGTGDKYAPTLSFEVEDTATPAPEPSSMLLGAMGLISMLGIRRKKHSEILN